MEPALIPHRTLALLALCALAWWVPGLADGLIWDRDAIARGEWWRLASGNLVHLSFAHLLANVLALGAAGWLLERRLPRLFVPLLIFAALLGGAALFVLEPRLERFAGASGIAYAALALLALDGLRAPGRWRLVSAVLLLALSAKLGAEWLLGWSLTDTPGYRVVPLSHAAGIVAALLVLAAHAGAQRCVSRGMPGRQVPVAERSAAADRP